MDVLVGRVLETGELVDCSVEVGEDDHGLEGDPGGDCRVGVFEIIVRDL